MYVLVRLDTARYGWVISQHKTKEGAESAYDRKSGALIRKVPNAIPHLVYVVANTSAKVKKGERINIG